MKLIWKGKMTAENIFIFPNLPKAAKPLLNPKSAWSMYLLIVPVLALAYVAIIIRKPYIEGIMFTKVALFVGVGLSLVFLVVHELLHALCCPKGTTVLIYFSLSGLSIIPTCKLAKRRYIRMALMPTIVLGIVPLVIWMVAPRISTDISSIIFAFSIGSLSMCIGDIYNVILAAIKMKKGTVLVTSEKNCYII